MGELHLEIYVERMKREYNVECKTGKPRVALRETPGGRGDFNYTHKKQTGGSGQFAKVAGYIEHMERDLETGIDVQFENITVGGSIPAQYIPGVEKVRHGRLRKSALPNDLQGFHEALEKGPLTGNPIVGCRFVLMDGGYHIVDSSELAFRAATIGAFREAFKLTKPSVLEPIMTVEVVAPAEFQSTYPSKVILKIVFDVSIKLARCSHWRFEYETGYHCRQRSR